MGFEPTTSRLDFPMFYRLRYVVSTGAGLVGVTIKTIECLCPGTIGLIIAPWKFDVLKTSIFALEASLIQMIKPPRVLAL